MKESLRMLKVVALAILLLLISAYIFVEQIKTPKSGTISNHKNVNMSGEPSISFPQTTKGALNDDKEGISTEVGSDQAKDKMTSVDDDSLEPEANESFDNINDIQVISSDEELEQYINSISDEEIDELIEIIEGIDISTDIGVDNDPGFQDIIIP